MSRFPYVEYLIRVNVVVLLAFQDEFPARG
jgi:hypothetical protein